MRPSGWQEHARAAEAALSRGVLDVARRELRRAVQVSAKGKNRVVPEVQGIGDQAHGNRRPAGQQPRCKVPGIGEGDDQEGRQYGYEGNRTRVATTEREQADGQSDGSEPDTGQVPCQTVAAPRSGSRAPAGE